jgi:CBS domain containing-hemolysin-like protein
MHRLAFLTLFSLVESIELTDIASSKLLIDKATGLQTPVTCTFEPVDAKYTCFPIMQAENKEPNIVGAEEPLTTGETITYSVAVVLLVCTAGVMSGLGVGLASIDQLSLEIAASNDPVVAKQAKTIFAVIDKFHWMLVTLLLCNAGAMEALPLALDKLVPAWAAIVCSVTGVLFFGEIIPQAMCTGPRQREIAVCMCPLVLCLMYLTCPISWPIAKLLDYLLGEHQLQRYNNKELQQLILLHTKKALEDMDSDHVPDDVDGIDNYGARVMTGALQIHSVNTVEVMTKMSKVDVLSMDEVLDKDLLKQFHEVGYSRIPISQSRTDNQIIAIFLTKSLVGYECCNETIREAFQRNKITLRPPIYFTPETSLALVAQTFKDGSSHMGVVCDRRDTATYLRDAADRILSEI